MGQLCGKRLAAADTDAATDAAWSRKVRIPPATSTITALLRVIVGQRYRAISITNLAPHRQVRLPAPATAEGAINDGLQSDIIRRRQTGRLGCRLPTFGLLLRPDPLTFARDPILIP